MSMNKKESELLKEAAAARHGFLREPGNPELAVRYGASFAEYNKYQALARRWRESPRCIPSILV